MKEHVPTKFRRRLQHETATLAKSPSSRRRCVGGLVFKKQHARTKFEDGPGVKPPHFREKTLIPKTFSGSQGALWADLFSR